MNYKNLTSITAAIFTGFSSCLAAQPEAAEIPAAVASTLSVEDVRDAFLAPGISPRDRLNAALELGDKMLNKGETPPFEYVAGLLLAIEIHHSKQSQTIRDNMTQKGMSQYSPHFLTKAEQEKGPQFFSEAVRTLPTQKRDLMRELRTPSLPTKMAYMASFIIFRAEMGVLVTDLGLGLSMKSKAEAFDRKYPSDFDQLQLYADQGIEEIMTQLAPENKPHFKAAIAAWGMMQALKTHYDTMESPVIRGYVEATATPGDDFVPWPKMTPGATLPGGSVIDTDGAWVVYKSDNGQSNSLVTSVFFQRIGDIRIARRVQEKAFGDLQSALTQAVAAVQKNSLKPNLVTLYRQNSR